MHQKPINGIVNVPHFFTLINTQKSKIIINTLFTNLESNIDFKNFQKKIINKCSY